MKDFTFSEDYIPRSYFPMLPRFDMGQLHEVRKEAYLLAWLLTGQISIGELSEEQKKLYPQLVQQFI